MSDKDLNIVQQQADGSLESITLAPSAGLLFAFNASTKDPENAAGGGGITSITGDVMDISDSATDPVIDRGTTPYGWIPNTTTWGKDQCTFTMGADGTAVISASGTPSGALDIPWTPFPCAIGSLGDAYNSGAFYNTSITSVNIPPIITTIGGGAFYSCLNLTGTFSLPSSVTEIGERSFGSTGYIGSLDLPDTLLTIGVRAFEFCQGLDEHLTIPYNASSIGSYAFYYCTALTAVYTNTPTSSFVGTNAFFITTALTTIYVGPSATGTYTTPFQGCLGTVAVSAWYNYPNPIPN